MSKRKILFQLSGSIACFKACSVISHLVKTGHELRIACTPATFEFIGRATLEGLSGTAVFSDTYAAGQAMDHIHLAKWAEIAVLCPATANSINQLAAGIAADTVGNLFLAYDLKKPYLIVPAMNEAMLMHPATQSSLQRLGEWGVRILDSQVGMHACGDQGAGRMAEVDTILASIESSIHARENL